MPCAELVLSACWRTVRAQVEEASPFLAKGRPLVTCWRPSETKVSTLLCSIRRQARLRNFQLDRVEVNEIAGEAEITAHRTELVADAEEMLEARADLADSEAQRFAVSEGGGPQQRGVVETEDVRGEPWGI